MKKRVMKQSKISEQLNAGCFVISLVFLYLYFFRIL
jgi:hypothetical protein